MVREGITLGPKELKLLFTLEKEGKTVFLFKDAVRILDTTASARNVLYRLRRKDRVDEIEKGKYLLVPAKAGIEGSWSEASHTIVPHLVTDYYVGFWTALSHWGLTEQSPRTVFVATTHRKRDVTFGSTTFEFVTLSPRKFFGWVEAEMAGGSFRVSDPEKTIVDCLDHPEYAGELDEVVKALWEGRSKLDFPRLVKYAKRQGVGVLIRRLGYFLEVLGLARDVRQTIAKMDFTGFMWLDASGPKKRLGYSKEYGLILNRNKEEILSWREI